MSKWRDRWQRREARTKLIVNIDVPGLAPAIEFYCAALGVRHSRTLDDEGPVGIA
jgi:hypothetical protein